MEGDILQSLGGGGMGIGSRLRQAIRVQKVDGVQN